MADALKVVPETEHIDTEVTGASGIAEGFADVLADT